MPRRLTIDTTDAEYIALASKLSDVRTALRPRIARLLEFDNVADRLIWLEKDPLLRRAIRFAQELIEIIKDEVEE